MAPFVWRNSIKIIIYFNHKKLLIFDDNSCFESMSNSMGIVIVSILIYHHLLSNPILRECEDEIHIPEMGTWESSGTPKTLEFDYRGQNTFHWGVLYIIGKLSKCRCRKWAHMSHLDIYITSYGKKKGQESK